MRSEIDKEIDAKFNERVNEFATGLRDGVAKEIKQIRADNKDLAPEDRISNSDLKKVVAESKVAINEAVKEFISSLEAERTAGLAESTHKLPFFNQTSKMRFFNPDQTTNLEMAMSDGYDNVGEWYTDIMKRTMSDDPRVAKQAQLDERMYYKNIEDDRAYNAAQARQKEQSAEHKENTAETAAGMGKDPAFITSEPKPKVEEPAPTETPHGLPLVQPNKSSFKSDVGKAMKAQIRSLMSNNPLTASIADVWEAYDTPESEKKQKGEKSSDATSIESSEMDTSAIVDRLDNIDKNTREISALLGGTTMPSTLAHTTQILNDTTNTMKSSATNSSYLKRMMSFASSAKSNIANMFNPSTQNNNSSVLSHMANFTSFSPYNMAYAGSTLSNTTAPSLFSNSNSYESNVENTNNKNTPEAILSDIRDKIGKLLLAVQTGLGVNVTSGAQPAETGMLGGIGESLSSSLPGIASKGKSVLGKMGGFLTGGVGAGGAGMLAAQGAAVGAAGYGGWKLGSLINDKLLTNENGEGKIGAWFADTKSSRDKEAAEDAALKAAIDKRNSSISNSLSSNSSSYNASVGPSIRNVDISSMSPVTKNSIAESKIEQAHNAITNMDLARHSSNSAVNNGGGTNITNINQKKENTVMSIRTTPRNNESSWVRYMEGRYT